MNKCKIMYHMEPSGPNGPMVSIGRCSVHNMPMPGIGSAGMLCPVGLIEQAVDDGIAKVLSTIERQNKKAADQD